MSTGGLLFPGTSVLNVLAEKLRLSALATRGAGGRCCCCCFCLCCSSVVTTAVALCFRCVRPEGTPSGQELGWRTWSRNLELLFIQHKTISAAHATPGRAAVHAAVRRCGCCCLCPVPQNNPRHLLEVTRAFPHAERKMHVKAA